MKKKIAVLLALVMMLSLLPVQAIGSPGSSPGGFSPILNRDPGSGEIAQITTVIPAANFSNILSSPGSVFLRFSLAGNANFVGTDIGGFGTATPAGGSDPITLNVPQGMFAFNSATVSGANAAQLQGTLTGNMQAASHTDTVAIFDLSGMFVGGVSPHFTGSLTASFVIGRLNAAGNGLHATAGIGNAANLTVDIVRFVPGQREQRVGTPIIGEPLVHEVRRAGIRVDTYRGMPTLVTHAVLPRIDITEQQQGNLLNLDTANTQVAIRLVAPRNFRWDVQPIGAVGGLGINLNLNAGGGATNTPAGVAASFNNSTQRDELNIWTGNLSRGGGVINNNELARIGIENARLIALPGAPVQGEVRIDVYVRTSAVIAGFNWSTLRDGRVVTSAEELAAWAGTSFANFPWGGNFPALSDWSRMGLHVANRGAGNVEVVFRNHPTGMSGTMSSSWLTGGAGNSWLNRNYYSIRLVDTAANSIFAGVHTWEFRLTNPGARFVAAELRSNIVEDYDDDTNDWVPIWPLNTTANPENLADRAVCSSSFVIPGLTVLEPNVFRLTPRANNAEASELNFIDVRFIIITEAGFDAPGGNVQVIVTGPNTNQTGTIATVRSPINVSSQPPLVVYRDEFDILPFTRVNPIVISESEIGALNVGTRFWINLAAVMGDRRTAIPTAAHTVVNVMTAPTINHGSGLAVREIPGSNMRGWEVVNPSIDQAGVITFGDIMIAGGVMTGVEYHIEVVSREFTRTAIFPNTFELNWTNELGSLHNVVGIYVENNLPVGQVSNHSLNQEWLRDQVAPSRQDIRFDGLTYSVPILRIEGTSVGVGIAPPIILPPGRAPIIPATLAEGATIQPRISAHLPPVPNAVQIVNDVMLVSARIATENFLGTVPGWIGVNQPITLTGQNAAGQNVTVVVTQGSPQAQITVQGQPTRVVDIAEETSRLYAAAGGTSSWPTGTIVVETLNSSAFLPIRFVFQTFEVPFRWDEATRSVFVG